MFEHRCPMHSMTAHSAQDIALHYKLSTQFLQICRPLSVMTLSGWN
jgi:hypothetical protein